MGAAQAAKAAKAPATGRQTRGQPTDAPGLAAEAVQSEDAPAAGTHVQVCMSTLGKTSCCVSAVMTDTDSRLCVVKNVAPQQFQN